MGSVEIKLDDQTSTVRRRTTNVRTRLPVPSTAHLSTHPIRSITQTHPEALLRRLARPLRRALRLAHVAAACCLRPAAVLVVEIGAVPWPGLGNRRAAAMRWLWGVGGVSRRRTTDALRSQMPVESNHGQEIGVRKGQSGQWTAWCGAWVVRIRPGGGRKGLDIPTACQSRRRGSRWTRR